MKDIQLSKFLFDGLTPHQVANLNSLDKMDRDRLLMAGVDPNETTRSATLLHMDHSGVYCQNNEPGLEIMHMNDALEKYNGLPEYFWKLAAKDQDEYTDLAATTLQGGYFVRVDQGVIVQQPVQSCLFMKAERVGQSVHNLVIIEENAEVHIITGCATSRSTQHGIHIGISEYFVKKGGKLSLTMIHNWGENVDVRPRSVGVVEEGGTFISNYILLNPVRSLHMYPSLHLNGRGAKCRFNSVTIAPTGSFIDSGNRVIMNAPETRAEILSRAITTGGTIIARGMIQANAVPGRGHLECKGLIMGNGIIHAIPELEGRTEGIELSHEAAVGKIAQEEIEYLMARGLDEEEATSTIVRGFLNVDIMGLPERLKQSLDEMMEELQLHKESAA